MPKSTTAKAPPPPVKDGPYSPPKSKKSVKVHDDYTSEGVEDNDIFLLPLSDYSVMSIVTILGAIVRLFRIYQPTSVVFDEVQYVTLTLHPASCILHLASQIHVITTKSKLCATNKRLTNITYP